MCVLMYWWIIIFIWFMVILAFWVIRWGCCLEINCTNCVINGIDCYWFIRVTIVIVCDIFWWSFWRGIIVTIMSSLLRLILFVVACIIKIARGRSFVLLFARKGNLVWFWFLITLRLSTNIIRNTTGRDGTELLQGQVGIGSRWLINRKVWCDYKDLVSTIEWWDYHAAPGRSPMTIRQPLNKHHLLHSIP